MTDESPPQRYDITAIVFHWTLAAAIVVVLPLGFLAARAPDSQRAATLLRVHIPLGILILLMTVARAIWRYRHAPPARPAGQPRWQIGVARVSHGLLYVVPIVMGISGIGLLALSGAAPIVFERVRAELPDFSRFPPMTVHALGAFLLVALLGLHVAAALYHQFYRRDRLLSRMGVGAAAGTVR